MAKILLVGCGKIGTQLGLELTENGHQCYGLKRTPSQLPSALHRIAADITKPDTLTNLPEGLDFVVLTLTPGSADEEGYRSTYIAGLKNIIQALHQQKQSLQRLFFISSTSIYAQHHGEWVDEYSDTNPTGYSGKVMLEAERIAQQSGYPTTRIRFSGIYGSDIRLIRWIKEGVKCPSFPVHYSNRIHQDDCVGVLRHLIELNLSGRFPEDIYLASDSKPATYFEIIQWLRNQLQLEQQAEQSDDTGFSLTDKVRSGSKRCSNQRLLNEGYEFRYADYRQGFAAILKNESGQTRNNN
ncbi:NAD(P)H-binding protein [Motiliproteus sp. MSK22-1]|uniref:NAD(P)H-binding protein n=1 Tax=Motiliproteus sp. MSK22-1 TaxID=1897630 RepID=UPI00130100E9|nr:NAD(P)H-binding protein [Motiliproteus sp. MSK22-1]